MATIAQNQQDDDKDENKDQTQPVSISGSAPESSSGQAPTPLSAPATSPKGTSSGSFTNLQSYLNANKGYNAAGGGLAGQIAGNIGTAQQQLSGDIGSARNQFGQQASANEQTFNNKDIIQQGLADPTKFVQDPNNLQAFYNVKNAQYGGPQSLSDLQGQYNLTNLQQGQQNLSNMTNEAQNETGRSQLLQQMFNRPTYTAGQQRLDNMLLQSNPDQLNTLIGTRQNAVQSNQALTGAQQAAQQQAQNLGIEASEIQKGAANAIGSEANNTGAMGQFDTGINQKLQDYLKQQNSAYNTMQGQLSSGKLSDPEMQALGLHSGDYTYGVDLNSLLNPNNLASTATAQNVANADDYAKYAALNKLAQTNGGFLNDASLAGKAPDAMSLLANNAAQTLASAKQNTLASTGYQTDQQQAGESGAAIQGYNAAQNFLNNIPGEWQQFMAKRSDGTPINSLGQSPQEYNAMIDQKLNDTLNQYGALQGYQNNNRNLGAGLQMEQGKYKTASDDLARLLGKQVQSGAIGNGGGPVQ